MRQSARPQCPSKRSPTAERGRSGLGGSGRGSRAGHWDPSSCPRRPHRRSALPAGDAGRQRGPGFGDARTARRKGLRVGAAGAGKSRSDGSTGRAEKRRRMLILAAARDKLQEAGRRTGVRGEDGTQRPLSETRRDTLAARRLPVLRPQGLGRGARTGLRAEPRTCRRGSPGSGTLPAALPAGPSPSCRWKPRGRVRAPSP